MSYGDFAYLYDRLMEDVPYDDWLTFVDVKLKQQNRNVKTSILDLACGTGELTVRLAQAGYEVIGIDLSEDMLAVANAKAQEKGMHIPFYHQDMTNLEGLPLFDVIIIFCDSLNYLQAEEDIIKTFKHVYKFLKEDGLFLFDVHSVYKISEIFGNQTFAVSDEDISYIWNCFPGDELYSVEHELSFFVKNEDTSMYERFNEVHYQRTFPIDFYEKCLKETGFHLVEINADFKIEEVKEDSERIFFTAKKGS